MLRHALSAIFGDMPNTEYAALLKSVQDNGFTHPKITTYEGKILDGWHRYRVAQHLGIESDLVFEELSEVSPAEFVLAENLHRRHLTASQRGQMVVEAHDWLKKGNVKAQVSGGPNGSPKSKQELASDANVGLGTIQRAKEVSRLGRADEVISGEKSASAVIQEEQEKATEDEILRVVLDSDMVIHDNALAMSSGILRKMPDMSAGNWKALRRNVLRVIHPDKIDMSEWTDAEKDSWTVLFEFMNRFLGELERDYREYAALK